MYNFMNTIRNSIVLQYKYILSYRIGIPIVNAYCPISLANIHGIIRVSTLPSEEYNTDR